MYSKHPLAAGKRRHGPRTEDDEIQQGPASTLEDAFRVLNAIEDGVIDPRRPGSFRAVMDVPGVKASAQRTAEHLAAGLGVVRKNLTAEQEQFLAYRVQTYGDIEARNLLVTKNMGLVHQYVRQYTRDPDRLRESIQEGALGVIRACETFDPSRGLRFSTYALQWIRAKVNRARDKQRSHETPIVAVDGTHNTWTEDAVGRRIKVRAAAKSLDAEVTKNDGATVEGSTLGDSVIDEVTSRIEDDVIERDRRKLLKSLLDVVIEAHQGDKCVEDIMLYRMLKHDDEALTLDVLGNKHGISRERVRQIEKEIVDELRRVVNGEELPKRWRTVRKHRKRHEKGAVRAEPGAVRAEPFCSDKQAA